MDILEDPSYTVPVATPASSGVAWLRSQVARFSEGPDHERRRGQAADLLDAVDLERLRRPGNPVANLADALGLPRTVTRDVAAVAASYQPHAPQTAEADAAVARLVEVAGGAWDEPTAARIGLLVQASAATRAVLEGRQPPVAATRRIAPTGEQVSVDLSDRPFGAGRHACPGVEHADVMLEGALAFHRLHDGPDPLVLVNAWDMGSALLLVDAGFPAIGTTSLGVNASHGLPDAAGASKAANLVLARQLVTLPVPVTLDIEDAYSTDPAEVADLAAELSELGIAGVNVEDGRSGQLADPSEMTMIVGALKSGAPELFVNARVDAHWLKVDMDQTDDRARAYAAAGADGIFVPGLVDHDAIASVVAAVDRPVNLLAQLPLATMKDLGVRRVSTGSLLYRAAMDAIGDAARAVRDGGLPPVRMSYDDVERLT